MAAPSGFSWIDKPLLAALARPSSPEDFHWLRSQGIELLLSLTEDRPRRDWAEDASLLVFHEPMEDMEAPSQEQLDRCVSAIVRANERKMGVAVHCGAGLGRTGVVLAAYFVARGLSAANAIARTRRLRPGSIETDEQAAAVELFARRKRREAEGE
jgi:atypical dual specificity phosphatase